MLRAVKFVTYMDPKTQTASVANDHEHLLGLRICVYLDLRTELAMGEVWDISRICHLM